MVGETNLTRRATESNRPHRRWTFAGKAHALLPGGMSHSQAACMSSHNLATYLNDHLAGSVAGVEMLAHIADKQSGLVDRETILRIKRDVEEDRGTLEALMARLGIDQSRSRKAIGWLSERFTRLKLAADDPGDHHLRAFEMIELISLGIEGKLSLWKSLAAAAPTSPVLGGVDYPTLMARAREQRMLLEPMHAALARTALAPGNHSGEATGS
jgi:hypothetical protein